MGSKDNEDNDVHTKQVGAEEAEEPKPGKHKTNTAKTKQVQKRKQPTFFDSKDGQYEVESNISSEFLEAMMKRYKEKYAEPKPGEHKTNTAKTKQVQKRKQTTFFDSKDGQYEVESNISSEFLEAVMKRYKKK